MHPDPGADASARLITFDTVGSTNAEALARARAGEHGPLWIVAARQTAGRGRRGNIWTSEDGNLFASLLLTRVRKQGGAVASIHVGGSSVQMMEGTFRLAGEGG